MLAVEPSEFERHGFSGEIPDGPVLVAPLGAGDRCHGALVLVVDPEQSVGSGQRKLAEVLAHQAGHAFSNLELLERVRESEPVRRLRPGAVLLDVMMPGLDGFEVCRQIRADEGLGPIRVVMLTSMAQSVDRERAAEAGADHFITKPIDEDLLLSVLDECFAAG